MKGGDKLYAYLIQSTTTTDMTPDQIHNLGLSEVARITREIDKVRREVGFKGTLPQFFEYMRTSPKFQPKSREELTQDYYNLQKKVDAQVPRFFSLVPKTPLEIQPYEPFREKFEAGGSYIPGTPDATRPGTFFFNAYDLPSRSTWEQTTLFLHEGEPGHHFQISLAQENSALPSFMRFGGNTAYAEGWALYAETLGYDMGFYKDPYQRFGTLNDEMLRAMRLVVDTGIHAKGWTRDQSIALHARALGDLEDRRDRGGRALHRDPEPGDRLQDRRADHPAAAQEGARPSSGRSSTSASSMRRCSTRARCR